MRKSIKAIAVTSAVIMGLAAAPALYAHDSEDAGGSMMGPGMMGSGMMGQGDMMNMMSQMSEMMEHCNKMMQSMNHGGHGQSNEQGHDDKPHSQDGPGTDD